MDQTGPHESSGTDAPDDDEAVVPTKRADRPIVDERKHQSR
jgi:hypothetical protein